MARVTVEDSLDKIPNRFALVHLATKRALQLKKDAEPLVETDNKECVTSLREIAEGKITFDVPVEDVLSGKIHKKEKRKTRRRR
ncbi:MAG: DNA-directed RNA polymerase subunit omega [Myxococcales bacterium]|nr:DNA-directed RNA polymerase subunit omega [Myxococcales bacterium]MCB9520657.1 DNA-directed RNA polymerase subunit omega [Myxococcales bacterium]